MSALADMLLTALHIDVSLTRVLAGERLKNFFEEKLHFQAEVRWLLFTSVSVTC